MSVAKKGLNGGFTGKIGNTVIYPLKGQLVERTIGEITKAPSYLQKSARQRVLLVTHLLRPVLPYVRIGFQGATEGTLLSPYNLATALNRTGAIKGAYPDQEVDFTKVMWAQGVLPVNNHVSVMLSTTGVIFSWDPKFMLPGMKATDQVMVMAYAPEKNIAFSILDGEMRKYGAQEMNLPAYPDKVDYYMYLSFVSSDRKNISNSVYINHLMF